MSYYPMGEVAPDQFCSELNVQGSCKPLTNICKPMTVEMLDLTKSMQRQQNRYLKQGGKKLLSVDGRIGPAVIAATNWIRDTYGVGLFTMKLDRCEQVAIMADTYVNSLRNFADASGFPAVKDPVSFSPPSVAKADGSVANPSNLAIQAGNLGNAFKSPIGLAALGVGALLLWQGSKKGSRRKKPASWF